MFEHLFLLMSDVGDLWLGLLIEISRGLLERRNRQRQTFAFHAVGNDFRDQLLARTAKCR